jgi:hypothetical protein
MTMLTKRFAAVAAGVFGPKLAEDRRLADSKRARLDQPSPPFSDPTRSADFSMTLSMWRFILVSVGFVKLAGCSSGRSAVSASSASAARASR